MRIASDNIFAGLEEVVTDNEPLAPFTWYKIGGPARYFVRPRSVEELRNRKPMRGKWDSDLRARAWGESAGQR